MSTSIEAAFKDQKQAVARMIRQLMGENGRQVAEILDRELGEQSSFDHRELTKTEVLAAWNGLPTIGELLSSSPQDHSLSLNNSSYAFRLTVVARIFMGMPRNPHKEFTDAIEQLGLGYGEVADYAHDFLGHED